MIFMVAAAPHRLLDASHILMAQIAVAFAVGIIFALGLAVSEMINPARVIGFLDVAGRWDPTLLLVMAGALAVTAPIFPVILSRSKPILAAQFSLPTKTRVDPLLIIGAVIFRRRVGDWRVSVQDRHWRL